MGFGELTDMEAQNLLVVTKCAFAALAVVVEVVIERLAEEVLARLDQMVYLRVFRILTKQCK
jgi:hypothetical protein